MVPAYASCTMIHLPMIHLATVLAGFSVGLGGDGGVQDEIDALRADLREFQRSQSQGTLDAERAAEIRAIVKDALSDAGTRTSMQDGRGQQGFQGDNFYRLDASGTEINSADGNFRYHLNILMQLRFTWNHREDLGDTMGFENRRVRFIMDGHAFGKEWRYALQVAQSAGASPVYLEEAWVGRVLSPQLQLKVGQFRPTFTREELMSAASTLFMEHSAINNYFRAGWSRGIALEWETDQFMWRSGVFDGITVRSPTTPGGAGWNTGNTNNLPWDNPLAIDWAIASRFDWKFAGTWKELRDYTPWLDMKGQATNLGVAVDAEQASPSAPFPSDPWMIEVTADLLHKHQGWSLFALGVFRRVQSDLGQSNEWGALVQASTMLAEKLETGVRYSVANTGASSDLSYPMLNLLELNLSYYFHKHSMKVQLDMGYSFDGLSANKFGNGFANPNANLLPDVQPPTGDASGQMYVAVQYQVLF
ncbi:MAG: hypothetical protein FJ254_02760 [Phycisphaerae bacterium]|nr:hypothetical protein [Phycisphaerae bacterium]